MIWQQFVFLSIHGNIGSIYNDLLQQTETDKRFDIFNLAIMYSRQNRFVVGTKLLRKISLVQRISSVMPD